MRPCGSCPTRLISIMSRSGGDSAVLLETFSPARWAAAHDAVRLGPANQAKAAYLQSDPDKAAATIVKKKEASWEWKSYLRLRTAQAK